MIAFRAFEASCSWMTSVRRERKARSARVTSAAAAGAGQRRGSVKRTVAGFAPGPERATATVRGGGGSGIVAA